MPFSGKVVLVTGASNGIGRATAEALARAGAAVTVMARGAPKVQEVVKGIEASGGQALAVPGDASSQADIAAAIAATLDWKGGLDAVVANAALGLIGEAEHFDPADWNRMMAVNLGGPFLLARAAIPHLRARGGGHILAVGSELSKGAMAGLSGYTASKWGLLGFMRALAMELRHQGIRVGTVLPGGTLTNFGPDDVAGKEERRARGERFLLPSEVADAILFMLTRPEGAWTPELDLLPS